jgi:MFS transporter, DHA1 family, inner membrane transport protein
LEKMTTSQRSLAFDVGLLTVLRAVLQTITRMIYPFLAVLSRGMGVEVTSITTALGISMLTSLLGPFLAPLSDRYGRRAGILLGVSIFTLSAALVTIFPGFVVFALSLFLGNLAINIFLPAVFAFLSDRTSYERRGLVMGIFEISWAACFFLVVPLMGLLIQNYGWQSAYLALAILGSLAIVAVLVFIPGTRTPSPSSQVERINLRSIFSTRNAILLLIFGLFFAGGNELVSVMFGVWIEDSFALQVAALGAASAVIGLSELGGEGLSAAITDRFGKERTVALGLIINCVALLTLPLLQHSVPGALGWLFLVYFSFELAMVSSISLASEVMPLMRATLLAAYIASHAVGRMLGDLAAPSLYRHGFWMNALACLVLNFAALFVLGRIRVGGPLPGALQAEPGK